MVRRTVREIGYGGVPLVGVGVLCGHLGIINSLFILVKKPKQGTS